MNSQVQVLVMILIFQLRKNKKNNRLTMRSKNKKLMILLQLIYLLKILKRSKKMKKMSLKITRLVQNQHSKLMRKLNHKLRVKNPNQYSKSKLKKWKMKSRHWNHSLMKLIKNRFHNKILKIKARLKIKLKRSKVCKTIQILMKSYLLRLNKHKMKMSR